MSRHLFAVVGVLALACAALAQEPKLVQPKKLLPAPPKGETARRLAEEVEAIESHLATKKAIILAAQVAVKAAELTLDRVTKAGVPEAVEEAKLALEAAKAQLMIRESEANEVAVKVKHAKRRAEEAQKADSFDDRKRQFDLTEAEARLELAKRVLAIAADHKARIEDAVKRGIVPQTEVAEAMLKFDEARLNLKSAEEALHRVKNPPAPKKP